MRRYALDGLSLPLINLFRDTERGLIFGVCAGLADRFDWPLTTIRVIAVIALLLAPAATGFVYLTAGLLLPAKKLTYYGTREHSFWNSRMGATRRGRR